MLLSDCVLKALGLIIYEVLGLIVFEALAPFIYETKSQSLQHPFWDLVTLI